MNGQHRPKLPACIMGALAHRRGENVRRAADALQAKLVEMLGAPCSVAICDDFSFAMVIRASLQDLDDRCRQRSIPKSTGRFVTGNIGGGRPKGTRSRGLFDAYLMGADGC
jgi:hypothetical protein